MLDFATFFLGLPGGIALLIFAAFGGAILSHRLGRKRPSWSGWRMAVCAALPVAIACFVLTGVFVLLYLHEDTLVPAALLALGLTATVLSFCVGLVASLLITYGART